MSSTDQNEEREAGDRCSSPFIHPAERRPVRIDVLKKFAATQMLAVHAARRKKRQRIEEAATGRTLRNVENLVRFQKAGMASRREAFVECIANMGTQAISVLSQMLELEAGNGTVGLTNRTLSGLPSPAPSDINVGNSRSSSRAGGPLDLSTSSASSSEPDRVPLQGTLVYPSSQGPLTAANICQTIEGGLNLGSIPPAQFFDLFRMTRDTFTHIINEVGNFMAADGSTSEDTVQLQVAIALWVLGGSEPLYAPLSTIPEEQRMECMLHFCRAVTKCLMPKVVSMSDGMDQSMWNFQCKFGLRNCAGALNFTHIPVHLGEENKDDLYEYMNSSGFPSIIMQAVVSSDYRFCDLSIGYPGRTHAQQVLQNSALWKKAENGSLFPDSSESGSRPNQGPHPYLIAGTCYPLSERIVTPFQAAKFTDVEKRFNNSIYNALSVTQKAFSLLRSRFPFLLEVKGVSPEDTPLVAAACCTLHNVCESRGEITRLTWESKASARQHLTSCPQPKPSSVVVMVPLPGKSIDVNSVAASAQQASSSSRSTITAAPTKSAILFREMVKSSMLHNYDRKF